MFDVNMGLSPPVLTSLYDMLNSYRHYHLLTTYFLFGSMTESMYISVCLTLRWIEPRAAWTQRVYVRERLKGSKARIVVMDERCQ